MKGKNKIRPEQLSEKAYVYVRQSSMRQVVEHQESGRRQRDLVQWVQEMGWPASQIVVLDADQGKSAQSSGDREAFKQLVGEVSLGEVGIVVGLNVSRFARNNADWFPLIEICGLTQTLIADEEGVYDPNDPNDRLILGLKGTMSEAEGQRIRSQLHGARWSKARRGELRRRPPTGYVSDERGRAVMDSDERVRHAFYGFFERFEQFGSACGVAKSYEREGLLFPSRWYRGKWEGPVRWRPLDVRHATRILHNAFYTGTYTYGERRSETRLDPETKTRTTKMKLLPLEEWEVLIHNAHPAYISWEQYLRNKQRLTENNSMPREGPGAIRSGASLLQGIVYCGRCQRRMGIRYQGRNAYALYYCASQTRTGKTIYCSSVPAGGVDRWVEEQLLNALRPSGIQAALGALEQIEKRSDALRREWEHRIEQAEYEVGLARRRYEAVDPSNRLVAANLERDWEQRLREVERLRQEFAERAAKPPIWISSEDRKKVQTLSQDIPRLWRLKSTKNSDRKKIVRLLIQDVWVNQEDEPRQTRIRIHWQTGAVTEDTIKRPLPTENRTRTSEKVVERIRQLYASSMTYREIAEQLNREALKPARNHSFKPSTVNRVIQTWRISKTQCEGEKAAASGTFQSNILS